MIYFCVIYNIQHVEVSPTNSEPVPDHPRPTTLLQVQCLLTFHPSAPLKPAWLAPSLALSSPHPRTVILLGATAVSPGFSYSTLWTYLFLFLSPCTHGPSHQLSSILGWLTSIRWSTMPSLPLAPQSVPVSDPIFYILRYSIF